MSRLAHTSQEVNKSYGKHRNKFFPGRWEIRQNGYCRGNSITTHVLAVKSFHEASRCPFCGCSDEPEEMYHGGDNDYELANGKVVSIGEHDMCCPKCHKWWQAWVGNGFESNVVCYDTEGWEY